MKVFLTGGTGRVGKAAVEHLVEQGHELTVVGRSPGHEIKGARYEQCSIEEYDRVESLMRGHDAVVHLAAIPDPVGSPGRDVYRVNALGTFHVFEAAAENGITRVVAASSINAFGYFFGDRGFPIAHLPIDESLPGLATDAYSFSKQSMEAIGRYFWERDAISSVLLRLPAVWAHDRVLTLTKEGFSPPSIVDELLALNDEARIVQVESMQNAYDAWRRGHRLDRAEKGSMRRHAPATEPTHEEKLAMLARQMANFFAYIDEYDSAHAIARGLVAEYDGSHALYVNSKQNSIGLPVADIARLYWPPVTHIAEQWPGDTCLCSIDRARKLIAFDPRW